MGHVVKDCFKKRNKDNGTSSNVNGKGKGQSSGNRSSVNSQATFTEQEKARFLEYAQRVFAMCGADGDQNAAANSVNVNYRVPPNGVLCARVCLLYTSPSPRDKRQSRMPSSA